MGFLLTVKKLCVGLVIIACSYGFAVQNTFAAEEVVRVSPTNAATTNPLTMRQATGDSQNVEMVNMSIRIEALERELKYLHRQIGKYLTVGHVAREAKELASDAWTLAVEARAIAVRAEEKADQVKRSKTQ